VPTYRYVFADVFTDTPLSGNQLAVFTDARGLDAETMQALALEIGFSETVFVLPAESGGTARIRIFNPVAEMQFAGHPTLGAAFVLGAPLQLGVVELETGAGIVPVVLERDESGRIVFGRMTQPVPRVELVERVAALLAALGVERSTLPIELYDNGARHIVVTLGDESEVSALRPDGPALASFEVTGVNCVAGSGTTWRSRMFWPHGEDPATGSAAGPIACHLARHSLVAWGDEIVIRQGVEMGRPSILYARAQGGNGLIDAVEVGGSAVVVARGEFRLPA
jgi:trans-2,3-dihydro-3-hydroxyanthranilate isomerase